jgi:spore photoproduct lyase
MPEPFRKVLEPNTAEIGKRLLVVRSFLDAGYEVHLNFSPVIVHDNWLLLYENLFNHVKMAATSMGWADDRVKAEVIFLTHNEAKHEYNLANKLTGEDLLWVPKIQESKTSQYGGKNIRYEHRRKEEYIQQFRTLHDRIIPWNTIRYIF